jgi:hypothetical protein
MQSGTIRCNTQTKRSNRYRKLLLVPTTQNEDDDHFYTPLGWDQSPICTRCALSVIPFAGDKGAMHINFVYYPTAGPSRNGYDVGRLFNQAAQLSSTSPNSLLKLVSVPKSIIF